MQIDGHIVASFLEVELRKVYGTSDLVVSEECGCGKIFQVFVVSDNINCFGGTFKIMVPGLESFKDCKQFFVMDVIV